MSHKCALNIHKYYWSLERRNLNSVIENAKISTLLINRPVQNLKRETAVCNKSDMSFRIHRALFIDKCNINNGNDVFKITFVLLQ